MERRTYIEVLPGKEHQSEILQNYCWKLLIQCSPAPQEIDLDPWAQAARDEGADANNLRLRYTGSDNPLTYDCLLIFCEVAPTTRLPALFHFETKTLIPVSDSVILFRKGQWYYAARPPIPEQGRQLEDWEYVRCLTARFTVPWADPPAEGHGAKMDTGA